MMNTKLKGTLQWRLTKAFSSFTAKSNAIDFYLQIQISRFQFSHLGGIKFSFDAGEFRSRHHR